MHIPFKESPLSKGIDPTRDESNEGQSLAFPVLTTSVNCAFPLSEKANVSTGTKAKVIQSEITKAKNERSLIIKVAVRLCDD